MSLNILVWLLSNRKRQVAVCPDCNLPVDWFYATVRREVKPRRMVTIRWCGLCGYLEIMIEVHTNPTESISDSAQTIDIEQFKQLMEELK